MKKFSKQIIAALLSFSLLWLPESYVFAGNAPTVEIGGTGGASSGSASPYLTLDTFERSYNHVCLTLWVATRGTTDSLDVVVQTNPRFASSIFGTPDTTISPWRTLFSFGIKTTTGFTTRCFPTGTPARDSLLEMYKYLRVIYRHSADSSIAGDTSSWFLYTIEDGNPIR